MRHALLQEINPGIKPRLLCLPALAGEFFTTTAIWEAPWEDKDFGLKDGPGRLLLALPPATEGHVLYLSGGSVSWLQLTTWATATLPRQISSQA